MTGVALLERAAGYALGAVETVTPELLSRPTPCRDWNLRMLLEHACESVAHSSRASTPDASACTRPSSTGRLPTRRGLRERVTRLLDALSAEDGHAHVIDVADQRLPDSVWPTSQPSRSPSTDGTSPRPAHYRPLPPDLAVDLLAISHLLVPDGNRHPLFASPVSSAHGRPQRLLATSAAQILRCAARKRKAPVRVPPATGARRNPHARLQADHCEFRMTT